jgi:hypothetical protein
MLTAGGTNGWKVNSYLSILSRSARWRHTEDNIQRSRPIYEYPRVLVKDKDRMVHCRACSVDVYTARTVAAE